MFFPAIGDGCEGNLNTAGSYCYYWSTDVFVNDYTKAYCMGFSDVFRQTDMQGRYYGFAVRPVSD